MHVSEAADVFLPHLLPFLYLCTANSLFQFMLNALLSKFQSLVFRVKSISQEMWKISAALLHVHLKFCYVHLMPWLSELRDGMCKTDFFPSVCFFLKKKLKLWGGLLGNEIRNLHSCGHTKRRRATRVYAVLRNQATCSEWCDMASGLLSWKCTHLQFRGVGAGRMLHFKCMPSLGIKHTVLTTKTI